MPGGSLFQPFPNLQLFQPADVSVNWSNLTPANTNCTYGIRWIWLFMGQCVMDTRGMVAIFFGFICLCTWIINGLPQIIENVRSGIPDKAISPFLLMFWTLGDLSNLIGCILAHQLPLQIAVSVYSVANDVVLSAQFVYFKLRHRYMLSRLSEAVADGEVFIEDNTPAVTEVQPLLNSPSHSYRALAVCTFGVVGLLTSSSSHVLEPTPKTSLTSRRLLMFTSTESLTEDFVVNNQIAHTTPFLPETSAKIGYILGWISTIMYVCSRFPQIFKNWKRQSTKGLCLVMFFLAVLANTSYGLQIFLTSLEPTYLLHSLPWIIGSVGVIGLDLTLCFQFYYYAPRQRKPSASSSTLQHTGSNDTLSSAFNLRDYGYLRQA